MCIAFISNLFKTNKKKDVLISVMEKPMESKFLELTPEEENKLVEIANKTLGITYKLGAEVLNLNIEPDKIKEIDCSEEIEYLYHKIGYKVPDGSYNQYDVSETFDGNLKIGDTFYRRSFSTKMISHVGLYIGNNEIIEASGLAQYRKVIKRTVDEIKKNSSLSEFAGFRRFLKDKVRRIQV